MHKKENKVINIILVGDPAAGKATQAKLLSKKYRLYDLDMGKELRALQNKKSKSKTLLDKTINLGKLAPTKLVRDILFKVITTTNPKTGILFDGTPRMIGEAKQIKKWLKQSGRFKPLVIYLSISKAESLKRMANRTEFSGGKLKHRPDDNAAAFKNRIKYHKNNVVETLNYLDKQYQFAKISGLGKPLEVNKRIDNQIMKFI